MKNYSSEEITEMVKNDVSNMTVVWEEPILKPSEITIQKDFVSTKAKLMKLKSDYQNELTLKSTALENAKNSELSDVEALSTNIEKEYQDKIDKLEESKIEILRAKEKCENIKKRIGIHDVGLEEIDEPIIIEASSPKGELENPTEKTKSAISVLFFLLIGISIYDGINMFLRLGDFYNDLPRNLAIACTSFGFVLYTSFHIKKNNTLGSWCIFIFALCIANAPQFLGEKVMFSFNNLIQSPYNIIAFLISFVGSIAITYMYAQEKKSKLEIETTPLDTTENIEPKVKHSNETDKNKSDYKSISITIAKQEKEIIKIDQAILLLSEQKEDAKKVLAENVEAKKKEILEAILLFTQEIEKINDVLGKIDEKIEENKDSFYETLKKYRTEVEMLQWIKDIKLNAHFLNLTDIN